MGKLIKLNPFISETVWGGSRLARAKGINSTNPVGETWEVSTLSQGSSKVGDIDLSTLCSLKYLVKFIDTAANLSIQVHPDDEYARIHENASGKTECWIILDANPGAGIYLGFKKGVTKKEFFNAVASGLAVDKFLNFIEVNSGDFFYIPPGTVHAIGSGITLCEVQQSSGITYRVWDWNRMGLDGNPRELHIDKARDVLNFSEDFNQKLLTTSKSHLFESEEIITLAKHKDFQVELINYPAGKKFSLKLNDKDAIVVLRGSLGDLKTYESALVLEESTFSFESVSPVSFLVVSGLNCP